MILERFTLCPDIEMCLMEQRTDRMMAVGLSRQHALNHPRFSRSVISCFPHSNNIYTYSVLMQARGDFPLLPHINDIIDRLVEHGFIDLWNRESQNYSSVRSMQTDESPQPLTVDHVLGAIVVLAVGLGLAIIVFAIEHLIPWSCKKKKIFMSINRPSGLKNRVFKEPNRRSERYQFRSYRCQS